MIRLASIGALALGLVAVAFAAAAQTVPPKLLSTHKDWDAFVRTDGGEKQCYMVSRPKSTSPKGVRRGDVHLMVTHWPARNIKQEVSVITGYTYMAESEVTARIAKQSFKMFTSDDRAWLYDAEADGEMVGAMKRGSRVIVEGLSSRNTRTNDRYSLIGFTAAYKAILKACKGG